MEFDFLIVGSGFFGSICAYELKQKGFKVGVLEKRTHIGGNCYTSNRDGINVHDYGIHVFHTSNKAVWDWINQFVTFNNFVLHPVANYKDELYSLPFNLWTFSKIYGVNTPKEVKDILHSFKSKYPNPQNLEEMARSIVGDAVYEKLIHGYTKKQWMKEPSLLPKEIIERLPVRLTFDSNYFNDTYQGIPIGGYTQIFEKLLEGIPVFLGVDYLQNRAEYDSKATNVIYTGAIDRFYDYKFGELEYKSTKFIHTQVRSENFQGCPMMNFTDENIPYTRVIEHKYFENVKSDVTWVSWEFPEKYISESVEPYYPVNDDENNKKYAEYKKLSELEPKHYFGGRLAEYKYYDMHQVIDSALNFVTKLISNK